MTPNWPAVHATIQAVPWCRIQALQMIAAGGLHLGPTNLSHAGVRVEAILNDFRNAASVLYCHTPVMPAMVAADPDPIPAGDIARKTDSGGRNITAVLAELDHLSGGNMFMEQRR